MTDVRDTPHPEASAGAVPPSDASLADIVGSLGENTTRLLRQEVALARAEVRQEVSVAGGGVARLAAAAFAAQLALILVSLALSRGLSEWMDVGWAYTIVGALWAIAAAVLASAGRSRLAAVNPVPERTAATIRETTNVMRGH